MRPLPDSQITDDKASASATSGHKISRRSPAAPLTILVPTRNEAANVEPLLARLSAALSTPATVLFVDDSDDETPDRIRATAAANRFPLLVIDLLHRDRESRRGGLAGAVVAGLQRANSEWICVMDGDLQHPPECVPALLAAALNSHADLVVASRYVPGGGNEGLNFVRKCVSWGSTALAKLAFPNRLRGLRDPMSGFFLLRREALTAPMSPRGFKILLEITVRHPKLVRREIPFVFVERSAGVSKGTVKEGLRYLRLLADMRWSLLASSSPRT